MTGHSVKQGLHCRGWNRPLTLCQTDGPVLLSLTHATPLHALRYKTVPTSISTYFVVLFSCSPTLYLPGIFVSMQRLHLNSEQRKRGDCVNCVGTSREENYTHLYSKLTRLETWEEKGRHILMQMRRFSHHTHDSLRTLRSHLT